MILVFPDGRVIEKGGSDPQTTNNRMELTAVTEGLRLILQLTLPHSPQNSSPIEVYTDSTYVIQGITKWIWGWMKKNWISASGQPVANQELWKPLLSLTQRLKVQWNYVRGHSGVAGNERADEIAVNFSQRRFIPLYQGHLLKYPIAILDLPETKGEVPQLKKTSSTMKTPAYSYLSLVQGELKRHSTWKECEARIKGRRGARFKKALSAEDEQAILKSWGLDPGQS
jgi:ribonuclease HI